MAVRTLPIPVWVLLVLALAPPNHCAAITAELRPNADVGVAFNDTPQGVFDVFVSLSRPEGWWIVTNEQSSVAVDKSGATIWNRIQASESLHRWEGVGSAGDCWSGVRFHGQLKKPGPEGQPPTFDASVADIDIDVDSLGTRSGDHWPPSGSYLEDSAEAVEGGGLYLPPSLITGSFPSELPPDSSYKLLNLTLRPKWVGPPNPGTVGDLAFSVTPHGVALYRVSNGSRVSGAIRVPAGGFSGEQFAILTNENFTTAGGIYATFTWDSYLRGGEYGATDYVRLAILPVIEADIVDRPPSGSTYASGIDRTTLVLRLNNKVVTPAVTDITDGIHLRYEPSTSELLSGFNYVLLEVKDRAGNEINPEAAYWGFMYQ